MVGLRHRWRRGASYYGAGARLDCTGDGVISNDRVNDPADCGSGGSDFTTDRNATIARLAPNNPTTPSGAFSDCQKPADGYQHYWISAGIIFHRPSPIFTVYGLTHGCTDAIEKLDLTCGGQGLTNVILTNVGLDVAGIAGEPGLLSAFATALPTAQVSAPTLDEIAHDSS